MISKHIGKTLIIGLVLSLFAATTPLASASFSFYKAANGGQKLNEEAFKFENNKIWAKSKKDGRVQVCWSTPEKGFDGYAIYQNTTNQSIANQDPSYFTPDRTCFTTEPTANPTKFYIKVYAFIQLSDGARKYLQPSYSINVLTGSAQAYLPKPKIDRPAPMPKYKPKPIPHPHPIPHPKPKPQPSPTPEPPHTHKPGESHYDGNYHDPNENNVDFVGADGTEYSKEYFKNVEMIMLEFLRTNGNAYFTWSFPKNKQYDGFALVLTEITVYNGYAIKQDIKFLNKNTTYFEYKKKFSKDTEVKAEVYPYVILKGGTKKYIQPGARASIVVPAS